MKIFGIQIGEETRKEIQESRAVLILSMINDIKQTEWGFSRRDKMLALRQFCQDSPEAVAALIFSSLEEKHKENILFYYALDRCGTTGIKANPIWAQMIRDYIFPRWNELSLNIRRQIEWWFKVKEYDKSKTKPTLPLIG